MLFYVRFLLLFGWLLRYQLPRHRLGREAQLTMALRQTTQALRDSLDNQPSPSPMPSVVDIQEASILRSLYVQIGVLELQWSITVSVTGERKTNASLTLALPHGNLFQMRRYRKGSSKRQWYYHNRPTTILTIQQPQRHWWDFLTHP